MHRRVFQRRIEKQEKHHQLLQKLLARLRRLAGLEHFLIAELERVSSVVNEIAGPTRNSPLGIASVVAEDPHIGVAVGTQAHV